MNEQYSTKVENKPVKRVCLTGTAPSWRQIPWDDPTLEVWGLNDSYLLRFPRADRWYDIHPFDKFHYRDEQRGKVHASEVPVGHFVRPAQHLKWLAQQSIPVFVQAPDPRVPRAQVFPRQAIEERFAAARPWLVKDGVIAQSNALWSDSTPSWMLLHALYEGYTEIHIYGIHLATEWEYQKQKPNLAYLCGLAAGMGVQIITPAASPLLKPTHQYAFEPDPALPVLAAQKQLQQAQAQRQAAETTAQRVPWYRWRTRADAQARRWRAVAGEMDATMAVEAALAAKRAG